MLGGMFVEEELKPRSKDEEKQMEQYLRRLDELTERVEVIEKTLNSLGNSITQLRKKALELSGSYQDILDKHGQLVIYTQSAMEFCENKDNINDLFRASDENSEKTEELSKSLLDLEDRMDQVEEAAAGKMPLVQGEQLLTVLKLHHEQLAEIMKRLG